MAKIMRHLVSKKKRRFEWGEFDLDLSYITDRIVAMGFPSESLEGLYRNNMKDVQKFFDSLHPSKYRIYNLCSERKYDPAKFGGNVREFPFDDHGPPNLDVIEQFCIDVTKWLDAHPENVIGVHCKAGKGRTGTLVSCYLIYSGYCKSASEACRLFGNKRTVNGKGITIPSQFRYVRYFEQMLLQSKPPPAPLRLPPSSTLVLNTILMYGVPNFNMGGGCEPYLGISQRNKSVYSSKPLKIKKGTEIVEFDCGETLLARDVKIQFFNKSSKGKMFSLCFHTGYVSGNRLKLRRLELDRASKDAAHKHFSPNFMVELVFRPPPAVTANSEVMVPTEGGEVVPPVTIQVFICASCDKPISEDDASVHHMERNWHWGCMRCTVCHQGLKDDMIFDKEGKPMCATCDKSTGFFKFCNSCGLLINSHISEDYGDASYHKECFECFDCGKYLSGVSFSTTPNKKLICEYCLNKPSAIPPPPVSPKPVRAPTPPPPEPVPHKEPEPEPPKPEPPKPAPPPPVVKPVTHSRACPGCRRDVAMSDDCIVALGTLWHKHCFVCAQCRKSFTANKYFIRDDKAYCEECDTSTRLAMLSKCMSCDEFIEDAELTEALGGMWHLDCFVCFHCKNPIAGPFASRDGKVYCKPDYENLFCTRCSGCSRVIQGSFFRALDKAYHRECFQCIRCGNNLISGQYFEIGGRPCCFPCKDATKFGAGKTQNANTSPVQSKFLCEHRSDSKPPQQLLSDDEVATVETITIPPPSPSAARITESSTAQKLPPPAPSPLPPPPVADLPPPILPPPPVLSEMPPPPAVATLPPPPAVAALPPPASTLPPPSASILPPPPASTLPPPPASTLPPPPASILPPVSNLPPPVSDLPPPPVTNFLPSVPPPAASNIPPPVSDLPPPVSTPPISTPLATTPPASTPPASTPPASTPPASTPPTSNPLASTPPPVRVPLSQSPARAVSPPGISRISLALSSLPPPPPAPVVPAGILSSSPARNSPPNLSGMPPSSLSNMPPPSSFTRPAFVTARPSQPTRQLSLSGGLLSSASSSATSSGEGSPRAFLSARAASSSASAASASASSSSSASAVSAPTPVPGSTPAAFFASSAPSAPPAFFASSAPSVPFGTTPPASARSVPIPTSPGGSPTLSPSSPPPVPRLLRTSPTGTPAISPPSSPTMRSVGAGARNTPQRTGPPSSPMQNRTLGFKTTSISSLPPPPPSPLDPQLLQRHNSDMSLLDNKSEASLQSLG